MDWSPKKRKRDEVDVNELSPQAKRGRTDSSSEDSYYSRSSGSPVSGEELYYSKPFFIDDKTCVQMRDEVYRVGDCVWLNRDQSYTSIVQRGLYETFIAA